jgi:3'-5' exoribonuclease
VATGDLDKRLANVLAAVTQAPLRGLLSLALDTTREPGATFAVVPAAIRNHHAYRHGLLEHSVIVAETALRVAEEFASVDRSLLVAGALLHDIGKTRAYSADPMATGMTDDGILLGEIVAGLEIVRGLLAETPTVSPATAQLLQHIIASHHGEREKGSPVVPQTREAVIVHYCDDMTASVAAIDEAARKLPQGSRWTPQRVGMLGVAAFLGEGGPVEEADEETLATDVAGDDEDFGFYDAVENPGSSADDDPGDVVSEEQGGGAGSGPDATPADSPESPSDAESAELGRLFDDA